MKKNMLLKLALGCLALQLAGAAQTAFADDTLKTDEQKTSYALGVNIGHYIKGLGVDMDTDALVKGIKDTVAGGAGLLTSNEVKDILAALPGKIAAGKAKEGETFLAKNKSEPGVITLTNGLQYKIITKGAGPIPKLTDSVTVNYRGTLVNGDEFDASPPGKPVSFPLTGVIPGWTQVLQLMPTGSKWTVYLPSNLAYGERGAGGKIGPNAALIFDIELLSIDAPKTMMPPDTTPKR